MSDIPDTFLIGQLNALQYSGRTARSRISTSRVPSIMCPLSAELTLMAVQRVGYDRYGRLDYAHHKPDPLNYFPQNGVPAVHGFEAPKDQTQYYGNPGFVIYLIFS